MLDHVLSGRKHFVLEWSLCVKVLLRGSLYGYGQVRYRGGSVQWIYSNMLDARISSCFGTALGEECNQSINHWGHTSRGASPRQPSDASSGNHPVQVPMQASFPIPINSQQEASTCPSHELCGRPLGLLHSRLSLSEITREAGSASG